MSIYPEFTSEPEEAPTGGVVGSYHTLKKWLIDCYYLNKQRVLENVGIVSSGDDDQSYQSHVDRALAVRDTSLDFLRRMKEFANNFSNMIQSQQKLFEFSCKMSRPVFQNRFVEGSPLALKLIQSGRSLISHITFSIESLETLCSKTVPDTLTTISQCDAARIRYGAFGDSEGNLAAYEALKNRVTSKVLNLEAHQISVISRALQEYESRLTLYSMELSRFMGTVASAPQFE